MDSYETADIEKQPEIIMGKRRTRLMAETTAKKLYPDRNLIELGDGRYVIYKKLLIATGGKPRQAEFMKNVPESLSHKVTTYRTVRSSL